MGPIALLSGQESPSFPVAVGSQVIEVMVTAPDGQHMKYRTTVTRASSGDGGGTPEEPEGSSPGGSGPGSVIPGPPGNAAPSNRVDVKVTINDESQEGMVTGLFHEANGHTVVSMKLDTAKLEARLGTVDYNPVIVIALARPADQVSLETSGLLLTSLTPSRAPLKSDQRLVISTFLRP